jgi:hypothetical protein
VQCLTPLAVSFVVAMGAVFGIREGTWLNELVALGGSIAGEGKVVFAEKEVVGFADFVRVILAFRIFAGLGVSGEGSGSREQDEAKQETGENCDKSAHLRLQHVDLPGCNNLAKLSHNYGRFAEHFKHSKPLHA